MEQLPKLQIYSSWILMNKFFSAITRSKKKTTEIGSLARGAPRNIGGGWDPKLQGHCDWRCWQQLWDWVRNAVVKLWLWLLLVLLVVVFVFNDVLIQISKNQSNFRHFLTCIISIEYWNFVFIRLLFILLQSNNQRVQTSSLATSIWNKSQKQWLSNSSNGTHLSPLSTCSSQDS